MQRWQRGWVARTWSGQKRNKGGKGRGRPPKEVQYRVANLVGYLDWVDFDDVPPLLSLFCQFLISPRRTRQRASFLLPGSGPTKICVNPTQLVQYWVAIQ